MLINLIKTKEDNVKAEAIEVLKGVLGPRTADYFVSLVSTKVAQGNLSSFDISVFKGKFSKNSPPSILCGLFSKFTKDFFQSEKLLVLESLEHSDGLVREKALDVFLSFETENQKIETVCKQMSNDPISKVSAKAKEKLREK